MQSNYEGQNGVGKNPVVNWKTERQHVIYQSTIGKSERLGDISTNYESQKEL